MSLSNEKNVIISFVEENDVVVAFLNFTGTHKGEFQGIPPTNKKINLRSADLYKLEDEIIISHWDVVDRLNLLQQTGGITFTHLEQQQ